MSETYCLRWDEHPSNLSLALRDMRLEESLMDVTLLCDSDSGGLASPLHAHKLILTSCSPFFREMFSSTHILPEVQQPHPVVFLRGIRLQDMMAILDFMYTGEVNVRQDELHKFIGVAKELKVKGLTGNFPMASTASNNGSASNKKSPGSGGRSGAGSARKAAKNKPQPTVINTNDLSGVFVKEEQQTSQSTQDLPEEFVVTDAYGNFTTTSGTGNFTTTSDTEPSSITEASSVEDEAVVVQAQQDKTIVTPGIDPVTNQVTDLNALVESLVTYEDKIHTCNLCGKKTPWRTTMVRHIESNHVETAGLVCDICGTVSKTRHSFAMHQKRRHDPNYTPSRKRKAPADSNKKGNEKEVPPKKMEII